MPRELSDLPFAQYLEVYDGALSREEVHDSLHLTGRTLEDVDAGGGRFLECAVSEVTFAGGSLRRARFNDVWFQAVRLVSTDLAETHWHDTELVSCSWAGIESYSAQLRAVTFHGCKLDSVNLKAARLKDVRFEDCLLRDVNLGGARLDEVSFPGSRLESVRLGKAELSKVDLTGAVQIGLQDGIEALRGATITHAQLMELAPWFAASAGVEVRG